MAADDQFLPFVVGGTDDIDLAFREDIFLASTLAESVLTPATITFSAVPVTAIPGAGVVGLTPTAVTFTARPLTPTPGMVTVALTPSQITFAAVALLVTEGFAGSGWQVHIELGDTDLGVIESAAIDSYSFRRGFEFGEGVFVANLFDPSLAIIPFDEDQANYRVAFYEDLELRWRGCLPYEQDDLGEQLARFRCRTYEAFWDERFFGGASRPNLLENPSFEDWTAGMPDSWGLEGSATVDQVAAIAEGTYAAKLTATDNASYLWQQEPTGADVQYRPGLTAIGSFWAYVESGTIAIGDVIGELIVDGAPGTFTEQWIANEEYGSDSLFRVSMQLFVAAGDWTGEIRARSMNGELVIDDMEITFGEATTVLQNAGDGEDLAVLVEHMTEYSQVSPWSALGITHDCPDTGIAAIPGVNLAGFDHSKHEWLGDSYRQVIKEYGVDIWVGLDKILHLRKKRGERRTDIDLTIDADDPDTLHRIAKHTVEYDPTKAKNLVVITGESRLFAADEAGASDPAAFGGLTLAAKEKARAGTTPLGLANIAAQRLAKQAFSPRLPTIVIPMDDGIVDIGDILEVPWDFGRVQLEGDYRITHIEVDARSRLQYCTVDADDGEPLDSEL